MKQGWEIKKLGDICDVLNGLWTGKKEPFINICVIRNTNFTKDCKLNLDDAAYIDVEVKQFSTRKLQVGDIIIEKSGGSEKQPVGRVVLFDIQDGDYSFSNFTSTIRVKDNTNISPHFLHKCLYAHYLRGETLKLQSKTTGIHNLDMKGYLRLPIPVPPLPEQERIVAELDCLSSIIEKQKEQLKELDNLAQSIFYTMFGDPITNENGWKVKKLEEIATSQIGITYKPENVYDDGVIVLRSSNIQDSTLAFDDIVRVNCTIKDAKYVKENDILMCSRNGSFRLVGKVAMIPKLSEKMTYGAFMTIIRSNYQHYLFAFFKSPAFRTQLTTSQTATINQITVKMLNEIQVALPPLSLQQEFASKIEAIEKQKELIKQSIAETETLFNSRMDYYFN